MPDSIIGNSPSLAWQPDGGAPIVFAGKSVNESDGQRLVPRERLYRAGALQDDMAPIAIAWTTVSHFFNGTADRNVPQNPYPGVLNRLCVALHSPGTLTLPTRGPVRARAATWQRVESDEKVDFATLTINWVADNQDEQDASTFTAPSARSAGVPRALEVQRQLASVGVWSADVGALVDLAAALEQALLITSTTGDDLRQTASALMEASARIWLLFGGGGIEPAASLLLGPLAGPAVAGLRELTDMAARATTSSAGAAQPVPKRYGRVVSLAFVARDVPGQTLEDLMSINGSLADPRQIPAGTPILVRKAA